MRIGLTLLLGALLALPVSAQSAKRVGVVSSGGTTARAGPSDSFPDTGVIAAGTRVVVVEVSGDWVAVEPPPGQRSWMPALVLVDPDALPGQPGARDPSGGAWEAVVAPDGPADVPVMAGDGDRPRPLPIQRVKVPAGTIVRVTGPAVEFNRAKWYPVEPPPGDLRYLPKAAVQLTARPAPGFAVQSPPNAGTPLLTPQSVIPASLPHRSTMPAGELPPVPSNAPTSDDAWAEAEAATQARDYVRAEKLYLQLAAKMHHADRHADAAACFARLHQVRTLALGGAVTSEPPRTSEGAWHGPGKLRATAFRIGDRDAYAVQGGDGKTLCYVVADAGVDLARFLDYQVELYGPSTSRADLNRVPLVTASRVQQARR